MPQMLERWKKRSNGSVLVVEENCLAKRRVMRGPVDRCSSACKICLFILLDQIRRLILCLAPKNMCFNQRTLAWCTIELVKVLPSCGKSVSSCNSMLSAIQNEETHTDLDVLRARK